MQPDQVSRSERIDEVLENARKAKRREEALLRAPVTPPSSYPGKEIRRICEETKEEFLRRG